MSQDHAGIVDWASPRTHAFFHACFVLASVMNIVPFVLLVSGGTIELARTWSAWAGFATGMLAYLVYAMPTLDFLTTKRREWLDAAGELRIVARGTLWLAFASYVVVRGRPTASAPDDINRFMLYVFHPVLAASMIAGLEGMVQFMAWSCRLEHKYAQRLCQARREGHVAGGRADGSCQCQRCPDFMWELAASRAALKATSPLSVIISGVEQSIVEGCPRSPHEDASWRADLKDYLGLVAIINLVPLLLSRQGALAAGRLTSGLLFVWSASMAAVIYVYLRGASGAAARRVRKDARTTFYAAAASLIGLSVRPTGPGPEYTFEGFVLYALLPAVSAVAVLGLCEASYRYFSWQLARERTKNAAQWGPWDDAGVVRARAGVGKDGAVAIFKSVTRAPPAPRVDEKADQGTAVATSGELDWKVSPAVQCVVLMNDDVARCSAADASAV